MGRGVFDKVLHIEQQVASRGLLPQFAVDAQLERQIVRVGDLVLRDQPRAQYAEAVQRLAEAAIFGAPHGHVEAKRVTAHVLEGARPRNVTPGFANHRDELDLVIRASIRKSDPDPGGRPDDGRR